MTAFIEVSKVDRLKECETTIERGLFSFIEMGKALREIRDKKLYEDNYDSFVEYCKGKWNLRSTYSYNLIEAAGVVDNLSAMVEKNNLPSSERIARELKGLEPDEQREVWTEVIDSGQPVTAKNVKKRVRSLLNKKNIVLNEIKERLSNETGLLEFDPASLTLAEHAEEILNTCDFSAYPAKEIEFKDARNALRHLENADWMYQIGFYHTNREGYGGRLLHNQDFHKCYEVFGAKGWEIILKRLSMDGVPMRQEWRKAYELPRICDEIEGIRPYEVIGRVVASEQWGILESGLNDVYSSEDVRENIGIGGREWLIKYLGISISNDEVAKNYLIAGYFQSIRENVERG